MNAESNQRVFAIKFANLYQIYRNKVERKGRTQDEMDAVLSWLTGYSSEALRACDASLDLVTFFAQAPAMNPNRFQITGSICGVKLDSIEDPTMREIRYMDKVIDELAQGKSLEKIQRGSA